MAPVPGRQAAGGVWTGRELLVWGGVPRSGGAAYDPAARTWRRLPDAPIDPREWHVAVWTGDEFVVWGGAAFTEPDDPNAPVRGTDAIGEFRGDGAAYDPEADSWRLLAASPLAPRSRAAAAWTGSEVVIVAGSGQGIDPGTIHDFTDGAAYDPVTDTWRAVPNLPDEGLREVGPHAVWTGDELLVGGSRFAPGVAAAYDPGVDVWRLVEGAPVTGGGSGFVAWTGAEAVLTDTMTGRLAALDSAAGLWRELPAVPVEWLDGVVFVAAGERLIAVGGLDDDGNTLMGAWMLQPSAQRWQPLAESPLADRADPVAVWTGRALLVWSGTAVAVGHEAAARHDGAAWTPGAS